MFADRLAAIVEVDDPRAHTNEETTRVVATLELLLLAARNFLDQALQERLARLWGDVFAWLEGTGCGQLHAWCL